MLVRRRIPKMFYILKGALLMKLRERNIVLMKSNFTASKVIEHMPVGKEGVHATLLN